MRNIELFCNNKKFLYDGYELKKDNVLFEEMGEGLESRVFKIDDETVLKVYKTSNEKEKLDEDMIEELSDIETNRIVLPKEIIKTKDGEVKGYSMDYVEETETKFVAPAKLPYITSPLKEVGTPMSTTPSGMIIVVNAVQFWKALFNFLKFGILIV